MQNGDFGRLGPRLDLPGKKIGGGPKAQGVSKSGEFNTLSTIFTLSLWRFLCHATNHIRDERITHT